MYGKSLRKTIAAKKNVACLFESIVIRKIDIIKISGTGVPSALNSSVAVVWRIVSRKLLV
ncbi:Uncharacterised protein [Salmonella enterica subsp. enterica]|uniref:Uncharacterized protein n=1 Tax=Salmonella enterica I TaxID=59201 RepID=A0A3S4H9U9_SALET|nr:Uncharacterised protein [Salmonella enterica subsp. enterica]